MELAKEYKEKHQSSAIEYKEKHQSSAIEEY
jgi:hypothetical protein